MKTLEDIKDYMRNHGIVFPTGDTCSPLGIQRQFDGATSFPVSIYYLAYDENGHLVVHRGVLNADGKVVDPVVPPVDNHQTFDRAMEGLL